MEELLPFEPLENQFGEFENLRVNEELAQRMESDHSKKQQEIRERNQIRERAIAIIERITNEKHLGSTFSTDVVNEKDLREKTRINAKNLATAKSP